VRRIGSDREVFGDVRTDEWKTKGVVEQQTSGKAMAIG
jgi:hypothetical protein